MVQHAQSKQGRLPQLVENGMEQKGIFLASSSLFLTLP